MKKTPACNPPWKIPAALPVLAAFLVLCTNERESFISSDDGEEGEYFEDDLALGKADEYGITPGPIFFERACEPGTQVVLAAVGDLLLHGTVQRAAANIVDRSLTHPMDQCASGYRQLFSDVAPYLAGPDLAVANLEVPLGATIDVSSGIGVTKEPVTIDGRKMYREVSIDPLVVYDDYVFTSYPMFNAHPCFARALVDVGFDTVGTANNHSLDRGTNGIDRTLGSLDALGLMNAGTAAYAESRSSGGFPPDRRTLFTEIRGIRLAFVVMTYATNGITDRYDQVSYLSNDPADYSTNQRVAQDRLDLIGDLKAREDVDMVIVAAHWGDEYHTSPNEDQAESAHAMLEAGADIILGSHPHVLQPMEKYVTRDGREAFVIYSLGNFISSQSHLPRRSTIILYLGITKNDSGDTFLSGVRYLPVYVERTSTRGYVPQVIDVVGGFAEARDLIVRIMGGTSNLQDPFSPIVPNAECVGDDWQTHPLVIESDHPYADNFDFTWDAALPPEIEASEIRLHFSRIDTEVGYDVVEVYDAAGALAGQYHGNRGEVTTPVMAGSSAGIRLVTDGRTTAYGFSMDAILYH